MFTLFSLFACASEPCAPGYERGVGLACDPVPASGEDTGGDASGGVYGDSISRLGNDDAEDYGEFFELTDAVIVDDDYAAVVGQGGLAVTSRHDGTYQVFYDLPRLFKIDRDDSTGIFWGATRTDQILGIDLSDPLSPAQVDAFKPEGSWHEGLAADEGRILVAMQESGAIFWNTKGGQEGTIPVEYAYAVALRGDRALVTDREDLTLWDVSDLSSPTELDRVTLGSEARALDFDGERIAAALGNAGAALLALEGDALVPLGEVDVYGSSFDVALDGDYVWAAAWSHTALIELADDGPRLVGLEEADQIAFGIAAEGGRATTADWFYTSALERNPDVSGPELLLDETLWFQADDDSSQALSVTNAGPRSLTIAFGIAMNYTVSPDVLTVEPGQSAAVMVTPTGAPGWAQLSWESDDPDEPLGQVELKLAETSLGQPHPEIEAWGFQWPDEELFSYTLSSSLGNVVFLDYYSSW